MVRASRMKFQIVKTSQLSNSGRLDCGFFLSEAVGIRAVIQACAESGMIVKPLQELTRGVRVFQPKRARKFLAAEGEAGLPYLRPYDVFEYLPKATQYVSASRTEALDELRLTAGQILQTCSGRNLGPVAIADRFLEGFIVSNDMLRIEIPDETLRYYVFAYLNSRIGFHLLRQGKTGSVIDHIADTDLRKLPIILPEAKILKDVSARIKKAVQDLETGRLAIRKLAMEVLEELPSIERKTPRCKGWTVSSGDLQNRIDAAFYDPLVIDCRKKIKKSGGAPLANYAKIHKPAGRYKTNYVDSENGSPLLSGGQLLQFTPINLRYMAKTAFKAVEAYELKANTIAYPADGRAEEELGTPVFITQDRNKWLASGHIGRILPNKGISPGSLYTLISTPHVQMQIKASASGSVVDSTFEQDIASVIVPKPELVDGEQVKKAWANISKARTEMDRAIKDLEKALGH